MKTKKQFMAVPILFLFLMTSCLFAQDRSDISGPNVEQKSYTKNTEPGSQVERKDPPVRVSDEYGEASRNGVLSGLNAAGNYANVPSNVTFDESFDGSIEMWINPAVVTGTQQLMGKGATSNFEFLLGLSGNLMYFRIGNTVFVNTAGTVIPANVWTHIAVTWTGGGPFTVTFYVNGAASGAPQGPTAATWPINTDPIKIGGPSGGFNEPFNGQIDEVRFWQDVRTLAEIRDNRFVGIGDWGGANTGSAITSSSSYVDCDASWVFNTAGWEDIGGFNATLTGAATIAFPLPGQPIPYNFALQCQGAGTTNYVAVPHNAAFLQNGAGSLDAWVFFTSFANTPVIMAKGNTSSNVQVLWGVNNSGFQFLRFGSGVTSNTGGIAMVTNTWYHIATTWTGSAGSYTVSFYVNGQLSGSTAPNTGTWNANTDPLTIGNAIAYPTEPVTGMIDEFRFWSNQLSANQVKAYMHNSSRSAGTMAGMIAAWGFDGNLINRGTTSGINGSFNTGPPNTCRFSAYLNETSSGAPSLTFNGYGTVVNKGDASFISGFAMRSPNLPINSAIPTTRDTIILSTPGTVTSVELFLHAQHTFCADLDIVLKAPNGQTRDISSDNGSANDGGYLTFFIDGSPNLVTNTSFFPPYSPSCRPEVLMGNMGSSPTNGMWILEVTDDLGGDVGVLLGWGIRLNGTLTGIQPISNTIPGKFELYQNYPNPFNPVTKIKFDLPKDGNVRLAVYDMLGKEVKTLVNEYSKAGQYEVPFDGSNLSSGAYFFRIEAGDNVDVKKMMLVK